jgi:peptidoglycan/LPS O-acetylase OafA/YrhL
MTTTATSPHGIAPAKHPDPRTGRILQLDVLRGIAILMVLWFHPVVPPERAGLLRPIADLGTNIGWSGVQLFFVLSGFLIGGLLFKEIRTHGRLNVTRFWIRRGLKIWPGYYALMAYVFVRLSGQQGMRHTARQIWPSLIALQNYLGPVRGHTWSLAVEEHFYLALPLLLAALPIRRRGERWTIPALPFTAGGVGLLVLGMHLFVAVTRGDSAVIHSEQTQWNIDAMFFGVLLGYVYHFHFDLFARWAARRELLPLGIAMLVPTLLAIRLPPILGAFNHTIMYLAYGMILMVFMQAPLGEGRLGRLLSGNAARAIGFIGFYSYAIYLWFPDVTQSPIYYALEHHAGRLPRAAVWICGMAVYVAASVAVGVILSKLVEFPMLALRDRWFPARASITADKSSSLPPNHQTSRQTDRPGRGQP